MKIIGKADLLILLLLFNAGLFFTKDKISAATCPCDIYSAAGTPCVGAFSTVRLLNGTYPGPLYQVRRASDNATRDIYPLPGGTIADAPAQDSFLGNDSGTFSKLYDQSGKGNHLVKAPGGCYAGGTGTALQADYETNAKALSLNVDGHRAYGMYMLAHDGYRNDTTTGVATGGQAQGIYELVDGKRYNDQCCWDFGNAETDNCIGPTGIMNAIYFGNDGMWGKGAGNGPWFMGDFEAGLWSGGSGTFTTSTNDPAISFDFAFCVLKTGNSPQPNYCIRVGSAEGPSSLTDVWDGNFITSWKMQGGIILGIGGDNSNSAYGTFYEGAITSGRPTNAADSLVLKNIQDACYGCAASTRQSDPDAAPGMSFRVNYNPSTTRAVIRYTVRDARGVLMEIFDQQGRRRATLVNGPVSPGPHEAVWNAGPFPAGVYVCRATMGPGGSLSGKIVVGK